MSTYDPYSLGLPPWAMNPFGGNPNMALQYQPTWGIPGMTPNLSGGFGGNAGVPGSPKPPFDWSSLGSGLAQLGGLFGGQGPQLNGYKYLNYPGAGGLPQMSPWAQTAQSQWQNLLASRGMAGGYDPAATYKIFANETVPLLSGAAKQASKSYQDLLVEQARKMMNPAMESAYAGLAGGSGEYSGYGMQQVGQAGQNVAENAAKSGAEAELALLNSWSQGAEQQLPAYYQQMYQMFNEPQWVSPVAAPDYSQGGQSWWQKMLQGGLSGAGLGSALGGWGMLGGGIIGALGGLLT